MEQARRPGPTPWSPARVGGAPPAAAPRCHALRCAPPAPSTFAPRPPAGNFWSPAGQPCVHAFALQPRSRAAPPSTVCCVCCFQHPHPPLPRPLHPAAGNFLSPAEQPFTLALHAGMPVTATTLTLCAPQPATSCRPRSSCPPTASAPCWRSTRWAPSTPAAPPSRWAVAVECAVPDCTCLVGAPRWAPSTPAGRPARRAVAVECAVPDCTCLVGAPRWAPSTPAGRPSRRVQRQLNQRLARPARAWYEPPSGAHPCRQGPATRSPPPPPPARHALPADPDSQP